jgi:hypothetical protein
MEEKVEVEINGRKFRVPKHMVDDYMKLGALQTKRLVREPPKELREVQPKKIILPPKDLLPVMKLEDVQPQEIIEPEKKLRKKPVRSKAK